jgi:hypothetical protein
MSQVGGGRVDQSVSAIGAVEVPVFVAYVSAAIK